MIGKLKSKIGSWIAGRVVDDLLVKTQTSPDERKRIRKTISKAVSNMMQNKPTMKNEPVLVGGIITIVVALAGSFGLELTAEELGVTFATLVTIISFIQRRLVTPTRKHTDQEEN